MKRDLGGPLPTEGQHPASLPWRGAGACSAPLPSSATCQRPPLLLSGPFLSQGHLFKLHVAALPGPALGSWVPQTQASSLKARRPTHFGALSAPSPLPWPTAAAGSPGSTPESRFCFLQAHVSRPPSSAPPAKTGRSGGENQFSGSQPLQAQGKTPGQVELSTAQPYKPSRKPQKPKGNNTLQRA